MEPNAKKINNSYESDEQSSSNSAPSPLVDCGFNEMLPKKLEDLLNVGIRPIERNEYPGNSLSDVNYIYDEAAYLCPPMEYSLLDLNVDMAIPFNVNPHSRTEHLLYDKSNSKSRNSNTKTFDVIYDCVSPEIPNQTKMHFIQKNLTEFVTKLEHLPDNQIDTSIGSIVSSSSIEDITSDTTESEDTRFYDKSSCSDGKNDCPSTVSQLNFENSNNAVDTLLRPESNVTIPKDLSFNGKLPIVEMYDINMIDESINVKESFCVNSPDLFADDDEEEEKITDDVINETDNIESWYKEQLNSKEYRLLAERESRLIEKMTKSLHGLSPPKSKVLADFSVNKLLEMYRSNEHKYGYNSGESSNPNNEVAKSCSFKYRNTLSEVKEMDFNQSYLADYHGIHYNRTKYSEELELTAMKHLNRYVGKETASCVTFRSPSKLATRTNDRLWTLRQSPGNRLSHLAKRREIFSADHLMKLKPVSQNNLLLDLNKKKICRIQSPKKKERPTRETSKRALFQSPPVEKPKPTINPEIAQRVDKSKRALFSPPKRSLSRVPSMSSLSNGSGISIRYGSLSSLNSPFGYPEERLEVLHSRSQKRFRDLDAALEEERTVKRQCIGSSLFNRSYSMQVEVPKSTIETREAAITRSTSESVNLQLPTQVTENQKKKLVWTVSKTLQSKKISQSHENFKNLASVLVKVVKRLFLEFRDPRGSSSEQMAKYANKCVYEVLQGKSVDDIYNAEKQSIIRSRQLKMLNKSNGYIARAEYESRKAAINEVLKNKADRNDELLTKRKESLQKSSSKTNTLGCVLRENSNVQTENRPRSTNKNNGDRENLENSPKPSISFTKSSSKKKSTNKKGKQSTPTNSISNLMRAKRQINFD